MTYKIVADKDADEQGWYEARTALVTASEVATLIRGGAGAWSALRAEKNGERRMFQNRAMTHGVEREPIIAEFARMTFGLIPSSALLINPDMPIYGATPDGITEDGTVIGEYKTTIHDWKDWSEVPPRYRDQMLWQMFVTGARRGKLVFEPHDEWVPIYPFPRVFELDYDEERVAELVKTADQFLAGGGDLDAEAAVLDSLLTARMEAKEAADKAADAVADLDELIRDQVDNQPTRFEGSRGNLTLSADSVSERFDAKAFEKADTETYQKFLKQVPVKGRLTISVRKES